MCCQYLRPARGGGGRRGQILSQRRHHARHRNHPQHLWRSRPDLARALRESGQRSMTRLSPRLRRVLTVGEIATALVLLIGAGLMVKSFRSILQVAPGFNPERVLTFELAPTAFKSRTGEKSAAPYQTIIERIRAIPGVASVGAISHLPIAHGG